MRRIDADALRREIFRQYPTMPSLVTLVDNAPTVGSGCVAKWEKTKGEAGFPVWRCSVCRDCNLLEPTFLEKYYFCPRCGAYTGGVVDE